MQSHCRRSHYFWLASTLIIFTVIRRELNHLPDLFINERFLLFNHNYDWWEDRLLLIIYVLALSFLLYAWRYCWAVLKTIPVWLYLSVAILTILQYSGENAIVFSHDLGMIVEELSETAIYFIALSYLWTFRVIDFDKPSEQGLQLEEVAH